jgi:hypothetical protein
MDKTNRFISILDFLEWIPQFTFGDNSVLGSRRTVFVLQVPRCTAQAGALPEVLGFSEILLQTRKCEVATVGPATSTRSVLADLRSHFLSVVFVFAIPMSMNFLTF